MPYRLRTFLICFSIVFVITTSFASDMAKPSTDPRLARNLMLIEQFRADPSSFNAWRLNSLGFPAHLDPVLKVFLYLQRDPDTELVLALLEKGIRAYPQTFLPKLGAHPYGIILAEGTASAIQALSNKTGVVRIAAADRVLQPLNDVTAEETGAAEVRRQNTPLRGRGVRVAVLDSGFRPGLPDLPDPAEAMDYADYPDTNRDVRDIASGHGTHVAGTVFGNGFASNGRWMGMAPDCDPIYLKIGNDTTAEASTAAVFGAIRGAAAWCDADILTMSYGGFDGYNDGSSPEEQAVDWAVGQGVTVFMSAGNSANEFTHVSGTLRPGETSGPIQSVIKFAPDSATAGFYLSWFDGSDTTIHRSLTAFVLDGNGDTLILDSPGQTSSLRGTETIEYLFRDFLPPDSSSRFFYVVNLSNSAQQFHILSYSSHWNVRFLRYDRAYTVCVPSTADSCISVGAYTGRSQWRDYLGDDHDDGVSRGSIAYFSSIGPRIDGTLKPDITAPGKRTISCRDTATIRFGFGLDYVTISNDGDSGLPADYLALMGTSMSSPAAAGTAALMLEANPAMTPSELRRLIYGSARTDEYTGQTPNTTWGWGKIDVMRALEAVMVEGRTQSGLPEALGLVSAFPNPFNSSTSVEYEVLKPGLVRITLFELGGREVWNLERNHPIAGRYRLDVKAGSIGASGVGWLELESDGASRAIRLVNLR